MRMKLFVAAAIPVVLSLLMSAALVSAQAPAASNDKPKFTAAQGAALDALYEPGGILIHLDEQRPGKPVVMIDFAGHPEFQDEWLKHLLPFPELTTVRLAGTAITDAGLEYLRKLPKLTEVTLNDTPIADAGLTKLANCKRLRTLNLRGTQVTPEAIAALRKALPELVVEASPPKINLSPEQALVELKKLGGILVHYDDRQPGNPVIMIDATNHHGFQDEWTRYFAAFPRLRQVGLSGSQLSDAALDAFPDVANLESLFLTETKITDSGLAKLAGCKKLKHLNVEGTRVTSTGVASLRKALPQLEIVAEAEKLGQDREWLDNRPVVSFADTARENTATESTGGVVKRFTAAEIKQWRERLVEISTLPEGTPNGWQKSRTDPTKMLEVFPKLKVRRGNVLRAYVFLQDGNSNGFVWALPADAEFPIPADCPRLEAHFLKPPKPFDALDDMMEIIEGDDSPESYLHASILRRELREFGGGWHGIQWGMHTVLDVNPWESPQPAADAPKTDRPTSNPQEWKWRAPRPANWSPEVRLERDRAVVAFYSYTPLMTERDNGEFEKERIILHTDTYRRSKYRPLVSEKKLAEGPNAVAH